MKNLNINVNFFLALQSQIKVFHWQTIGVGSHAQHTAFGEFYGVMDGLIDSFVEQSMGKYGRFELDEESKDIELMNYKSVDLKKFVTVLRNQLVQMSDDIDSTDTNLLNLRDEMLGELNKLSYLLTFE